MRALYIAMQAEAQVILDSLNAELLLNQPVIGTYYQAEDLLIATSGKDRATGVDCVGTEPAALISKDLITHHGVTSLLNAVTCGAHSSLGAKIADAYLISPTIFNHDHRIPLPNFDQFGIGAHPTAENIPALAKKLKLPHRHPFLRQLPRPHRTRPRNLSPKWSPAQRQRWRLLPRSLAKRQCLPRHRDHLYISHRWRHHYPHLGHHSHPISLARS